MKTHFHFITLFPETIRVWLSASILGRAEKAGLFSFDTHQLRDFSTDRHRSVDDVAYGGGGGMVLKLEPLVAAVEAIKKLSKEPSLVIYFTPTGKPMNHARIETFVPERTGINNLILVCGHYEGVDQRFIDHWVDHALSLGDFVLTGGELPALAFADALIRQLDGTLGREGANRQESFALRESEKGNRLLEYPHYTRPSEFRGLPVPEILLSGDHGRIQSWREEQSLQRTRRLRPDLFNTSDSP